MKYIVAQERHKDEGLHAHVYWEFDEQRDYSKNTFADIIIDGEVYHGNYQTCKSDKAVARYCVKDGDYISNFDVRAEESSRGLKKRVGAALIQDPGKLLETVQEQPQLLFGLRHLQADLHALMLLK